MYIDVVCLQVLEQIFKPTRQPFVCLSQVLGSLAAPCETIGQLSAQCPNKHWESLISISDQHSVKHLTSGKPQRKSSGLLVACMAFPCNSYYRTPHGSWFHIGIIKSIHLKFGLFIFERMLCPSAVPPRCALGFEVAPRSCNPSCLPKLSSVP